MKQLILGGVRSGKSALAERLAGDSGQQVCYIATATAGDSEMEKRIKAHMVRRPDDWKLIEQPIYLADTLEKQAAPNRLLLVDCLTLWLTNLLMLDDKSRLDGETSLLVKMLPDLPGDIIMVGNEANMGVVPMDRLSRLYCDEAGMLHQQIAKICDRVIMTIAGLPQILKGEPL